jgi:hypothetical protein
MPVLMTKPPNGVARWPCHRNAKLESNRLSNRTCVDVRYDAGAAAMDTRDSKPVLRPSLRGRDPVSRGIRRVRPRTSIRRTATKRRRPIERTATWPDTALLERAISDRHASDEASVRPLRAHPSASPRQRETPPGNTLGGVQSRVRVGRNESFGGRSAERVGWSERGRPRRRSSGRVATGAKGQGRRSTPGAPSPSRSPVQWSRRTSKEAIEQTQRVG